MQGKLGALVSRSANWLAALRPGVARVSSKVGSWERESPFYTRILIADFGDAFLFGEIFKGLESEQLLYECCVREGFHSVARLAYGIRNTV